ncbi:MAG: hypothetical protein ACJ736_01415 [Streptomyces sp.]
MAKPTARVCRGAWTGKAGVAVDPYDGRVLEGGKTPGGQVWKIIGF